MIEDNNVYFKLITLIRYMVLVDFKSVGKGIWNMSNLDVWLANKCKHLVNLSPWTQFAPFLLLSEYLVGFPHCAPKIMMYSDWVHHTGFEKLG